MKPFIAVLVFILALGLSYKTIANEPAVCTTEKTENCSAPAAAEQKSEAHGESHGEAKHESAKAEHGSGHNDLSVKMNSLFPQKEKDTTNTIRPATTKTVAPKFLAQVAAGTVKLQWAEATNATSYHVQVATDPNFKWLVINEKTVQGTSYDAANLETGKRYFWRVASVKTDNESSYTKSLFTSSAFDVK